MKQHRYAFLDGLRGFAAIFVMTRHMSFWHPQFYRTYLAVDLFFILSGFVIAAAYDAKIRDGVLGFRRFMIVRLIRLYPVFLLSVVVSFLAFLVDTVPDHGAKLEDWPGIMAALGATLLFVPFHFMNDPKLFPLNGPYWSLFFELAANALYARFRARLTDQILGGVIFVSGMGVALVALCNGNLDLGFYWSLPHVAAGFVRAIFGIAVGLFLYRHADFLSGYIGRISPWLVFPIAGAVLALPEVVQLNGLIDILCVFGVFPLCVLAGAKPSAAGRSQKLCLILGSASYPVYVLHAPFARLVTRFWPGIDDFAPYVAVVFVLGLIGGSVLLEKYYDLPIRKKLLAIEQGTISRKVPAIVFEEASAMLEVKEIDEQRKAA